MFDSRSASDLAVRTFPNPVSSYAQFAIRMPTDGDARLDIYDVNGRRVDNVLDGSLTAGDHTVPWQPDAGLRAGTYFYRLVRNDGAVTGKFVVVR